MKNVLDKMLVTHSRRRSRSRYRDESDETSSSDDSDRGRKKKRSSRHVTKEEVDEYMAKKAQKKAMKVAKKLKSQNASGYSNDSNPFGDANLNETYVAKFVKRSDRVLSCPDAKYTNLYVKNLDQDVTEEHLHEKFSEFGKIASLVILKDEIGTSRGFGFVNFENPDDVRRAMEAMHAEVVSGCCIGIGWYNNHHLCMPSFL